MPKSSHRLCSLWNKHAMKFYTAVGKGMRMLYVNGLISMIYWADQARYQKVFVVCYRLCLKEGT